jgi:hypothetical protein
VLVATARQRECDEATLASWNACCNAERTMNWKYRTIIAAFLGISCSASQPTCGGKIQPQRHADTLGSVGSNGLDPDYYVAHQRMLTQLMQLPLTDANDSTLLNPAWGTLLLNADQSQNAITFVKYVLGCTVSLGRNGGSLSYNPQPSSGTGGASSTPLTFKPDPPRPLLNDTGEWIHRPLRSQTQLANVHRCMATRLNKTPSVQYWVAGGDVAPDQPLDAGAYPVVEAYWAVTMDGGASLITIWGPRASTPRQPNASGQTGVTLAGLGQPSSPTPDRSPPPNFPPPVPEGNRFCIVYPQLCDIQPSPEGTCTPRDGGGGWTCNGRDAIETRLSCSDCCDCTYPTPKDFCNQNGCSCTTPCPDGGTDGSPGG